MIVAWPETLPRYVDREGFQYTPNSGIIRTDMDAGIPKVRRRFTAVTKDYQVSMSMSQSQFETFEMFFENPPDHISLPGIMFGSVRFYFPNPIWSAGIGETEDDRPNIVCRLKIETGGNPYSVSPDGDTVDWKIRFVMEVLPSA
jgi:hypothetical protein